MIQRNKLKLMIVMLVALLSSCSVTKMRYTRGFNVDFLSRNDKTVEIPKKAATVKKDKRIQSAVVDKTPIEIEPTNIIKSVPITEPESLNIRIGAPKTKPVMEYKFWNRLYTQIDKAEVKINTLKPVRRVQKSETMATNGDGTSGVWGILGFIFGLIALWPLAIMFSIIGMGRNRNNRGLAIAGLVLGIIWGIVAIGFTIASM